MSDLSLETLKVGWGSDPPDFSWCLCSLHRATGTLKGPYQAKSLPWFYDSHEHQNHWFTLKSDPLSLHLWHFKNAYQILCVKHLHPQNGEFCPWKMQKCFHSPPYLLTGEQRQICKQDCAPSFFSFSINGSAELLFIVTKISETSEQGLYHIKNPEWSFVAVLIHCCIRYILLPEKHAGRKKTFFCAFLCLCLHLSGQWQMCAQAIFNETYLWLILLPWKVPSPSPKL